MFPKQRLSRAALTKSRQHDRQSEFHLHPASLHHPARDIHYDIRDDMVAGLPIRVYPSGTRTFTLERSIRGRQH